MPTPDASSPPPAATPTDRAPSARRRIAETGRPSAFWPLVALLLPPWALIVRYRFRGRRPPAEGAFILAPNHYSEIDPLVVAIGLWRLGRIPRFLAKKSLFTLPVVGFAMRAMKQIPVERGRLGAAGSLSAGRALTESGGALIVYPEGTLTRDPDLWPMRGKTGAVRLALETGVPLIPVAHWGAQRVMARYSKRISLFPRKTIDVLFGEPLDLSAYTGRPLDGATLTEATEELMAAITALLAQLRGETPPARRWDPSEHEQSETGRF